MNSNYITVVGAGLAGSEAAWQLAQRGMRVRLVEMRPDTMTPAHKTGHCAELVCSNSLKSERLDNASGLLKAEMGMLNSLLLEVAGECRVPAGVALAVDRERFAVEVSRRLESHPNIEIIRGRISEIDESPMIIATGPLTDGALADAIARRISRDMLFFFDAAAPIVTTESIDMSIAFAASRHGAGEDYLNSPMDKPRYEAFVSALLEAETAEVHDFEKGNLFEGCMPVESIAGRGRDSLRFGPMRPIGLTDPRTGRRPYAVAQLRREDAEGRLYNLVGFQTRLKFGEQKRVFSMLPGLEQAEFVRYGVMHRNTFICSPGVLGGHYELIDEPLIAFAGQLTGVEGYFESAASGIVAALGLLRRIMDKPLTALPLDTALGALANHVSRGNSAHFQPMNANFGILPPLLNPPRDKREKNKLISERALNSLKGWIENNEL